MKSIINSLRNKINEKKPQNQLNLIKKSKEDKEEKISDPKPKNPIKQEEWDKSQNNERQSADMETKIAKYLAKEVLKNSQMIRKIHSNASVRKLLEFDKSKVEI